MLSLLSRVAERKLSRRSTPLRREDGLLPAPGRGGVQVVAYVLRISRPDLDPFDRDGLDMAEVAVDRQKFGPAGFVAWEKVLIVLIS